MCFCLLSVEKFGELDPAGHFVNHMNFKVHIKNNSAVMTVRQSLMVEEKSIFSVLQIS